MVEKAVTGRVGLRQIGDIDALADAGRGGQFVQPVDRGAFEPLDIGDDDSRLGDGV